MLEVLVFGDVPEAEEGQGIAQLLDDHWIGVGNPKHPAVVAAFGIKDACQKTGTPGRVYFLRRSDDAEQAADIAKVLSPDHLHGAATAGRRGKLKPRRYYSVVLQPALGSLERLVVAKRKAEMASQPRSAATAN